MNNNLVVETHDLPEDVVLVCRKVGICYRKPYKFGASHRVADREFWPFKDLDLQLRKGETLGVIGRNGAGKSTLLRLLASVTDPDQGQFLKRPNLNVQLLSVNLGFERILSGRENAMMAGMLLGKTRSEMRSRLELIKEFSELGDFFEEPVYSYSSGMVARLGFSVAIQADPDVLLLDELLSVGDQAFRKKSSEAVRSMIGAGKSVVLVMHDMKVIKNLADRVLEL